jgi:hypothetical protein
MRFFLFCTALLLSVKVLAQTETKAPPTEEHFQTACYSIDDDVLKEELNQSGDTWQHRYIAYEKENCEVPYLYFDNSFAVKQDGNKLDLTYQDISYTPLSSEVAEALNLSKWCGLTGWKKDEAQNVLSKECGDYKAPKKGQGLYSIYELRKEGTELALGVESKDHKGDTAETRHDKLSDRVFLKK